MVSLFSTRYSCDMRLFFVLKSSETFLLVSLKLTANHRKSPLLKDDCSRHNLFSEANSLLVLEGARVFQEIIRMFPRGWSWQSQAIDFKTSTNKSGLDILRSWLIY